MAKPFVIGVDFGTLSARGVLLDARNGKELASTSVDYPHGVISDRIGTTKLKPHSAFQDPADYLDVLEQIVPSLLKQAKVRATDISAIGTDFTSCTVLPVKSDGTPLCLDKRFARNPHAWVKLWKHHATQPEADHINETARKMGEEFIRAYGGKYSSEWFFSKVLETLREAPDVYEATDYFIEGCDWIVWQLTGTQTRNVSAAGFKGMRVQPAHNGWIYPSPEFFAHLHPKLRNVVSEKLGGAVLQLGSRAGALTDEIARRLKLPPGIPVAAGNIDAHAGVPACGVTYSGTLVMIMGTSTCHLLITDAREEVEGICGVVQDGVVPGYWGYEAGQSGVGDLFAWYLDQAVPAGTVAEAKRQKLTVHELLSAQAAKLRPGETGLLALDWWAGNRSVLVDADLTGAILGLTIRTRPHEIYRALIEATAFGTRKIVEAFVSRGLAINEIVASGGLAQKNALLMQIYADILQRPITVATSEQSSAFGAAMWGAIAGGLHPNIHEAADHMVKPSRKVYAPSRPAKKNLRCTLCRIHPASRRLWPWSRHRHEKRSRDPAGGAPMIRVRPALRHECPQILEIYNEAVLNTTASYDYEPRTLEHRLAWFDDHQQSKLPIYVATGEQDRVLGWSALNRYHDRKGYRFTVENSIYIEPSSRGQGIGKLLLAPLIHSASELGLHAIIAVIDSENLASIRLHERFGFERVGLFKQVGYKFNRWLDVIYMELIVPAGH